jgi:hypothetical protein
MGMAVHRRTQTRPRSVRVAATAVPLLASCCAILAFSLPRDAHALGPVDVEIGAIIGGGTTPSVQGTSTIGGSVPNPLGFGAGARAGVRLDHLYAGVEGMYYFGGSADYGVSASSYLYGVDLGGSFEVSIVTIRPLVGIGGFTEMVGGLALPSAPSGEPASGNLSSSQSYTMVYVQPGITGLIPLGPLYVGADANVLLLTSLPTQPSSSGSNAGNELGIALTLHAQVGVRF